MGTKHVYTKRVPKSS